MEDLWAVLRFGHFLAAVFMAAPLYALLAVNERGRFGTAIVHDRDHYMEGMIRRQPLRCFAYLAMLVVTGLLLSALGGGLGMLSVNRMLAVHVFFFLLLVGLLSYVHFALQPRIDALLGRVQPAGTAAQDVARDLWPLRRRRKKMATALLLLAALFAWRVYRSLLHYGWF